MCFIGRPRQKEVDRLIAVARVFGVVHFVEPTNDIENCAEPTPNRTRLFAAKADPGTEY